MRFLGVEWSTRLRRRQLIDQVERALVQTASMNERILFGPSWLTRFTAGMMLRAPHRDKGGSPNVFPKVFPAPAGRSRNNRE